MEFSATEKQIAIFCAMNVKFFMTKPRFASKGRIFSIFGGHSANEPGLSPSISLIVFTAQPNYFGVSQYHVGPLLRCFSVPHLPRTSVFISAITPCPSVFVSQHQITSACVRPHHQHSILTFIHLNLRSVSCDPRPFSQWPVEPLETCVECS